MDIKCLLLDIEGTTTSISFVKDELFPYIRRKLESYLESNWDSLEVQDDVESLRKQATEDATKMGGVPEIASSLETPTLILSSVITNINWNMDQDRKMTALKQLQGHMWREGYSSGEIQGHLYEDVEGALKLWTSSGQKVYIYSSGSVEAQKLLFQHSVAGNLLQYFSGHFDTKIGVKIESASYQEISKSIGVAPDKILFLTDLPAEAIAANEAGVQVKLLVRPGNAPLNEEILQRFGICHNFKEIQLK
ncbi:enolase-phosphatase E1-like [Daphnia pulicaria]|uniref:enolase-phosphatase E1-like n=1 Tax=Daphnia pulicaria TaxID=35523 RepID=UPI001EEB39EE|nr:enolase-phosphatase E1-like [Daphnia pulicaria]